MLTDRRGLFAFLFFAVLVLLSAPAAAQYEYCTGNTNGTLCPDQGEAAAAATAHAANVMQSYISDCQRYGHPNCDRFVLCGPVTSLSLDYPYQDRGSVSVSVDSGNGCSSPAFTAFRRFPKAATCEARNTNPETAPGTRLMLPTAPPSRCVGGCVLSIGEEGQSVPQPIETVPGRVEGQPVVFYRYPQHYTGQVCDGSEADETDFVEDDEQDKECIPSAGVCFDSEGNQEYCIFDSSGKPTSCLPAVDYDDDGIHDEDDPFPNDPTDGADDGEGNEVDNRASGGGTCNAPPSCAGDGIACATLFQQWKTRCAVEALSGDGGGVPGGTGDGLDRAAERSAIDDLYKEGDGLEGVSPSDAWATGEPGTFDDSMFGTGGGCPAFPHFSILGQTFQRPDVFCDIVAVIRLLVLASGFLYCVSIVLRAD